MKPGGERVNLGKINNLFDGLDLFPGKEIEFKGYSLEREPDKKFNQQLIPFPFEEINLTEKSMYLDWGKAKYTNSEKNKPFLFCPVFSFKMGTEMFSSLKDIKITPKPFSKNAGDYYFWDLNDDWAKLQLSPYSAGEWRQKFFKRL